jgi:hypothetical protein
MQGRATQTEHTAAIARVLDAAPHARALRVHVKRIIESPAFKGSRRSQEFLQFVTDRALDGHFEDLKERTLGVELFGRAPSYDTGDDAIVRVTACDVRKRLAQFHAEAGHAAEFRIDLPAGSYIPEMRRTEPHALEPLAEGIPVSAQLVARQGFVVFPATHDAGPSGLAAGVSGESQLLHDDGVDSPARADSAVKGRLPLTAIVIGVAVVLICGAFLIWNRQNSVFVHSSPRRILPWSSLVLAGRQTHVIFCDPEIVTVQRLLNFSISLSDYANRQYWPDPALVSADAQRIMQAVSFRGATVAAVDAEMALRISGLIAGNNSQHLQTHVARGVRLVDFKTEDGFILFGSPRSNPWVELFQEQLDFTFEFDNKRRAEFIRNRHPRSGEAAAYVPTAEGWGTGHAYAIAALVANPNQAGEVLLLAGSNAEATEAAGKFATNLDLLSRTLKSHGIDPNGPTRHFEVLLRVSTLAGSPNTFDIVACHPLPERKS